MIISCGDLRLVGSTRYRKVVQNPGLVGGPGVPKVAPESLTIYGVERGLVGGWLMVWCFKKLHQNSYPGRLVFSLFRRGSMGWCSKSWGGVPKSCTRTPTLAGWCSRCCADGVVFQKLGWCSKKVVPESLRLDGVVFQKFGWCSKNCPRIPTLYTTIPDASLDFKIN